MVLFPEVTGKDYSNFAPWMTYKCLIWCSNIRDVFSAGGTKDFNSFSASAVMARMLARTDLIVKRISDMTDQEIKTHWKVEDKLNLHKRTGEWISLISEHISVSQKLIDKNVEMHPELFKNKWKKNYPVIIKARFIDELRSRIKKSVSEYAEKVRNE